MKKIILLFVVLFGLFASAQETFPVNDVQDERDQAYAFTNATIHVDYQTKIENATLLIRSQKVERAGEGLAIPSGYTVIDLKGKHIYPSMIDLYTHYGVPKPERQRGGRRFGRSEQITPKTDGAYNANDAIKSHVNAAEGFKVSDKDAKTWRELGFGAVLTFVPDGIARGSSALVTLADDTENNVMLNHRAAAHFSFSKGTSEQDYPSSAMGAMALLRQTHFDAAWYASLADKPFTDQSLESWNALQDLPQIFETNGWMTLLRADKIGDEIGVQYIIKGGGDEYQRIDLVKKSGASLIVPVNFPDAYDVEDPLDTRRVSLAQMKHWELAPTNPSALAKNGISFALTTHGLDPKKIKQFWSHVRKAVKQGLSEEDALKALTHNPAHMIGMGDMIGSLGNGKTANFIIVSGNLFDKEAVIHENWIQGKRYEIKELDDLVATGKYKLTVGDQSHDLEVKGKPGKYKLTLKQEGKKKGIDVKSKFEGVLISMRFKADEEGLVRLAGWIDGTRWQGTGELPDGAFVPWQAERTGDLDPEKDGDKKGKSRGENNGENEDGDDAKDEDEEKAESDEPESLGKVIYPFLAYGNETLPTLETILITGATVWTNESDGVLEDTDVLIENGKIKKIGKGLKGSGAKTIDGKGKHLTPGIIDEHSHIALSSVNDVATNSGMVRMGDVVDSEDIDIYRQLAGGVTAAQLLHGSANPVGGQSALVKMRWGASPEEMLIKDAAPFIKFALGENVKRSRSQSSTRFPQTRMGVEQVYRDAFTNAVEYERKMNAYNGLSSADKAKTTPPRRDLVHETMLEIIRKKRFITCHSYVQSEINMLMKVAEDFGFRINTFTHILEGYKVADKMAAHGVGGSTFADWWNYKWEVRYAIPYGPALMHREGVVVAINSDDAEMGRRLNQEAAKSIKYGGLTEEEALKLVTLNPAKLLHLDDRMGSVKPGKDADLVLWSDNPLSIYAKPEVTMVDGTIYFDLEKDAAHRTSISAERARLIQKMLKVKKGGGPTRPPMGMRRPNWHCDDIMIESEGDHVLD